MEEGFTFCRQYMLCEPNVSADRRPKPDKTKSATDPVYRSSPFERRSPSSTFTQPHREPKNSPRSSGQLHLLLSFPSSVPVVFSSLPTSSPTRAPVASTTGVGGPSAAIIVAHVRIIPRIAILVIILIHLLLAVGMVIVIGD